MSQTVLKRNISFVPYYTYYHQQMKPIQTNKPSIQESDPFLNSTIVDVVILIGILGAGYAIFDDDYDD